MKRVIIILTIFTVVILIIFYMVKSNDVLPNTAKEEQKETTIEDKKQPIDIPDVSLEDSDTITIDNTSDIQNEKITRSILDMPFLVQAPLANWDPLHEEACEEASILMINAYKNNKNISTKEGESAILELTKWEEDKGYGFSISLSELNEIAKQYFNLNNGRIVDNPTAEMIKNEIIDNKPIIIPAAGKLLSNPNFRNGGPNYHMLVIKGFDETNFITNDPGTRKGESYKYRYNALMNSIHDWDSDNILNGKSAYLVFD